MVWYTSTTSATWTQYRNVSTASSYYQVGYDERPKHRERPYRDLHIDIMRPGPIVVAVNPPLEVVQYNPPDTIEELKEYIEGIYGEIPKGVYIALNPRGGANIRVNRKNYYHMEWIEEINGKEVFEFPSGSREKMCIGEMGYKKEISVQI